MYTTVSREKSYENFSAITNIIFLICYNRIIKYYEIYI